MIRFSLASYRCSLLVLLSIFFSERGQKSPSFFQERVSIIKVFCQKHGASDKQSHPSSMINKLLKIKGKRQWLEGVKCTDNAVETSFVRPQSFPHCLTTMLKSSLIIFLFGDCFLPQAEVLLCVRLKRCQDQSIWLAKWIVLTGALPDVYQQKV